MWIQYGQRPGFALDCNSRNNFPDFQNNDQARRRRELCRRGRGRLHQRGRPAPEPLQVRRQRAPGRARESRGRKPAAPHHAPPDADR
ncbi:protein of unknown function [Cupriavidus taiwanensis]|nr:protein of unknown function [Cupriavidus taiwanensis]